MKPGPKPKTAEELAERKLKEQALATRFPGASVGDYRNGHLTLREGGTLFIVAENPDIDFTVSIQDPQELAAFIVGLIARYNDMVKEINATAAKAERMTLLHPVSNDV